MTYSLSHIAKIIKAEAFLVEDASINHLLIDSRKIVFPEDSLFFAIKGPRRNGHQFVQEVYDRGIRNFIVGNEFDHSPFTDASFLKVTDVLLALQQLAAFHRSRFSIPVFGITGSNGKTIVKEWLFQLLYQDYRIIRSPRSYNSQVGVPLSIWQMDETHELGIFEAGISTVHEMKRLQAIIKPTMGIFTNISDAHSEGFTDNRQKVLEKALLFSNATSLVYDKDALNPYIQPEFADKILFQHARSLFSWSRSVKAGLTIISEEIVINKTLITGKYEGKEIQITIPFTDRISTDNAITCWVVLLQLGYQQETISERMILLEQVDMRMQLKKGINNCYLLNDSYSNDITSLQLALDFLLQQAGENRTTVILSDILQSGRNEEELYQEVALQLKNRGITRMIGIGTAITKYQHLFTGSNHSQKGESLSIVFYPSTEVFLQEGGSNHFKDEYILLKGARVFAFERISQWLELKVHQTVMEINLTALVHNLKQHQQCLHNTTKLMAMVKAFSYGSGSAEVARILQFHKVDYLAVAYADEGVELRKAGISLPIMVMNADEAGFDAMVNHDLEPEIYSFPMYYEFHNYLSRQGIRQFPVHIKFNTGMNRLGFEVTDAPKLADLLLKDQTMTVRTVFSHLAASENPALDTFTQQQVNRFKQACVLLEDKTGRSFLKHIANSAAIARNPDWQFDMVRLGIGLYGVENDPERNLNLLTVITLKSTIAQIRKVALGDTVGYGRMGVVKRDSLIATVRIGYADGLERRLGNGVASLYVRGKLAPIIGNISMDMTMIDITDIPGVSEGDDVEVFGRNLTLQQIAEWSGTITYEILTGISQRVKRVYLEE